MKFNVISLVIVLLIANLVIITFTTHEADANSRYPIESFGSGVSAGLPTSGDYNCVGVGNVNGDSDMDIIIGAEENFGTFFNTGLYLYTGNGAGTWTQTNLTTTNSFAGIEIADCDGDGFQEIYAGYQENANGIAVWEWNGTGYNTTGATSPITTGGVNYINIENISGDPGLDMVVASHNGLKYYEGDGAGSWTEYSTGLISSGMCAMSDVADINNDGLKDIVLAHHASGGVRAYYQNSGATPSWTDISSTIPSSEQSGDFAGMALGDVNNDGDVDIVYSRYTGTTRLMLLLGNGGGISGTNFQWTMMNNSWSNTPSGNFWQIHLNDVDLDGDLDLLAAQDNSGLHLYLGNGSSTPGLNFTWTEVTGMGLPTTMNFYGSNFLDFDNDGDLDIVGCTYGNGAMVFQNNLTVPILPTANAGNDQIIYLGNTTYLNGTNSTDFQDCPAGDITGTILTYDWNFTNQPLGSILTDSDLSPSDSVAVPSFVPTHKGNYSISLSVQDMDGHWSSTSGEDSVKITVILINSKPIANAGADFEAETGSMVILNGSGSNDQEDTIDLLAFDWNVSIDNPAAVTLDNESAIAPKFIAPNTTGVYKFTLIIQDSLGAWSLEDEVNITIVPKPNMKPIADAGVDFTAYSNTTVYLNGSGSHDEDGNLITWDWNSTTHPGIAMTNENSSSPSFTPTEIGLYTFTLRIMDNNYSWSQEALVNVTIIEKNLPPLAYAGDDFTAYVNETTYLNGSLSFDLDGAIITWIWNCTSNSGVILENANSSSPSFIPDTVTNYIFTLKVKDNNGAWSALSIVNVTVIERVFNNPPKANAGENQTVFVNSTVYLDGAMSFDDDGNITTWDWNCTSRPTLIFNNENSSQPSFYASEVGYYEITLRVQDNAGAWSMEDTIIITVQTEEKNETNLTNHPPTITLTAPLSEAILSDVSKISWNAYDIDGDPLTISLELLDAKSNVLKTLVSGLSSTVQTWNWDTTKESDGLYMIRISVTDGNATAQDTSGTIEIKNIDDKDLQDEDSIFDFLTSGFGLILMMVLLIIIIIIVVFIVVRSKKREDSFSASASEVETYEEIQDIEPPLVSDEEYAEVGGGVLEVSEEDIDAEE